MHVTAEPHLGPEPRRSSSARAVLQVLALLSRSPDGLRADEAAAALGRSVSTAYSLLDSLCQEGFAVHARRGAYHLAPAAEAAAAAPEEPPGPAAALTAALDELFARTSRRSYLAIARGGRLVVPATRGRQGMRRLHGLGLEVGDGAHALALGKVALALAAPAALSAYVGRGLRRFTARTIVLPDELFEQLGDVREEGVATGREEFEPGVCCMAAPVLGQGGRAVAILGLSAPSRAFAQDRDELRATLLDVAAGALPENPPPS